MPRKSATASQFGTVRKGKPLDAPDFLSDGQAEEWNTIVRSLPADYFQPSDVPLLAAFVIASATHKQAAAELYTTGLTVTDDKGRPYANPLCQVMQSQASSMASLAMKLRLCQSARYTEKSAATKVNRSAGGSRPWDDEDPTGEAPETSPGLNGIAGFRKGSSLVRR